MSAIRAAKLPALDDALLDRASAVLEGEPRTTGRASPGRLAALDARLRGRADTSDGLDDLLAGAERRFEKHVRPLMVSIPAVSFEMGTAEKDLAHFCGEAPLHRVELSPFAISRVTVTNELYALFDARHVFADAERTRPVTGVRWIEASLFALSVGCRLPTEAEWEYACGAGSRRQWCCGTASELERYAWYSENAQGAVHPVATRKPNGLGLFDMHGNVWEWCADAYAADWYARSPAVDPLNLEPGEGPVPAKVCRGGSMYALAEMCRSRYRQYEAADFWAADLGFRLVRPTPREEGST